MPILLMVGFTVLLSLATPCCADQTNGSPIPISGLSVGVGVNANNPGYVGYHNQVTPFPLLFYRHGRLFFAGISAGYVVIKGGGYSLSLVVRPRILRLSASDSSQLAGLSSRRPSLDGGAVFSTRGHWGTFNVSLFTDLLGRNHGREVDAGYVYPIHLGAVTLSPGLGVSFENTSLTYYYYGVSPAETRPGRPAYTPGTAINPYVKFGLEFRFGKRWRLFAAISYRRLAATIQDSPIVDVSHTASETVGISYTFGGARRR
ncbi:MAG: MipA/OmpV family protein [Gammaproteobacteria bacterium]